MATAKQPVERKSAPTGGGENEAKQISIGARPAAFLLTLLQLFPSIFDHVQNSFTEDDIVKFGDAMKGISTLQISTNDGPFFSSHHQSQSGMNAVQEMIVQAMEKVISVS